MLKILGDRGHQRGQVLLSWREALLLPPAVRIELIHDMDHKQGGALSALGNNLPEPWRHPRNAVRHAGGQIRRHGFFPQGGQGELPTGALPGQLVDHLRQRMSGLSRAAGAKETEPRRPRPERQPGHEVERRDIAPLEVFEHYEEGAVCGEHFKRFCHFT